MARPPLPPYTLETAAQKARMAEDAWNRRDPETVALAYTEDSRWRNRSEFFQGREAIRATGSFAKFFATSHGIPRDAAASSGIRPSASAREGCSASTTNGFSIAPLGRAPRSASCRLVSLDVVVNFLGQDAALETRRARESHRRARSRTPGERRRGSSDM
jgi:hypothetical protein